MKRLIQAAQLLLANESLPEEIASELDSALDWTDIIEVANKVDKKYLPAIEDWYLYSSHNNDAYGLIKFATKVIGANIPKIQKVFINNISDPSEVVDFAEKVPGADIPSLQEALFNTYDLYPSDILDFSKNVKGADILKLQDKLLHNEDTSVKDIIEFAKEVPGANVQELEKFIVSAKDPDIYDIVEFANEVPKANLDELISVIKHMHDSEILKAAKEIKKINALSLQPAFMQSSPEVSYIMEFAKLPGVNVSELQKIFLKSDPEELDLENLIDFYKIKGANKKEIENYIKDKKGEKIYERLFGKRPTQVLP